MWWKWFVAPRQLEELLQAIKLQNFEILDKIEELIAVMQNGFKMIYVAMVVICLLSVIGVSLTIVTALVLLNR
jgi:hypothetical protein